LASAIVANPIVATAAEQAVRRKPYGFELQCNDPIVIGGEADIGPGAE
jgi:hypothetical protein